MKRFCIVIFTLSLLYSISLAAETFRVATYNIENYLGQPTESRRFVKSADARGKIRESIKVLNPDVIALEEMGTTNVLLELHA
jgi:predicted extracellular nuclease